MSVPPAAPPLPPPVVPSHPDAQTPPPPPPTLRPLSPISPIHEQPSAPFPSSPSSLKAVHQVDYDPDAVDDVPVSFNSEEDGSADSSPRKKHAKPERTRRRFCFSPHSIRESGSSRFLPTSALLLFRLAVAAMLVSHMVYFTLTSAFSPRLYAVWAYAGLALAFVGAVFCSLMQLLREDIVKEAMRVDEEDGGHAADTLLGQEPVDRGLARFVAQVTVPLYQVFVTVSVFGAVVFWAAILPVQSADISYPLLALNAIAPAVAVLDILLSMSIEFRLVYVLLVALFNAAYAGTLYVFYKTDGIYVYNFINPSQEKGAFIAKTTGLAVASIVAGLFVYSVTAFSGLMFRRRTAEKKTKKGDKDDSTADVKSVSDKDVELESQVTLDSSQDVQSEEKRNISAPTEDSHEFDEDEVVVADMDEKSKGNSKSSMEKRNRHSVPTQSPELARSGSNRRWYRSSTAGRLQGVISLSSLAEEAVEDRPISVWEEKGVDSAHAPQESEYFTMPAAYNGGRNEVVKLTPVVHAGTQFARSGSGRQLFKSGSGRHFVRSGSGRAIARSGSGRAIVRSSSRASSRSSVVGPRP